MKYPAIMEKKGRYESFLAKMPPETFENLVSAFDIRYTHDSTAMEGNTLSLAETKLVLEDGITPNGKKLREIYEVVNHNKAYQYVKRCIAEEKKLDETIVKELHATLMENIQPGGIYRNTNVYISGAQFEPPPPADMYRQVKDFYTDLDWKSNELDPITMAGWTHAEFVRIHPFTDGNGRTSRLLMNYQLISEGFPPVSIPTEKRLDYYEMLEQYALTGEVTGFADMVAGLLNTQLDRYLELAEQMEQDSVHEPKM